MWGPSRECLSAPPHLLKGPLGVVEPRAVLSSHKEPPKRDGMVQLQDVANGEEVSQGLAHLLRVDVHKAVVHLQRMPDDFMSTKAALALG